MNTGTALYQGNKVIFTDVILFQGKQEFLIAYNNEAMWVREADLIQIVYMLVRKSA